MLPFLVSFLFFWALWDLPMLLMTRPKPWEVDWDDDRHRPIKDRWARGEVARKIIALLRIVTVVLAALLIRSI